MVDVEFRSRAKHFVPLSVLKGIAAGDMPEYLTTGDVDAIKGHPSHLLPLTSVWLIVDTGLGMALLNRGRLSVQRVECVAWDAIQTMADQGGWVEEQVKKVRKQKKQAPEDKADSADPSKEPAKAKGNPRKRKAQQAEGDEDSKPVRRSTRMRTKG